MCRRWRCRSWWRALCKSSRASRARARCGPLSPQQHGRSLFFDVRVRQPGASAHGTAAERLWRNTAAGGLPSEGSAFSGTLLRMLQISGTTVAELIDKLPSAVWTQVRSQPVQKRIACLTAALAGCCAVGAETSELRLRRARRRGPPHVHHRAVNNEQTCTRKPRPPVRVARVGTVLRHQAYEYVLVPASQTVRKRC